MRRRKSKNFGMIISDIYLERAGAEGKCIGWKDGKVIIVSGGVPGDTADLQIVKEKKDYIVARVDKIKKASEIRINPLCAHFGICGDCSWQSMNYESQAYCKEQQVYDAIFRIAKIENPVINNILRSNQIYGYRNKVQFTFSSKAWIPVFDKNNPSHLNVNALGYFVPQKFDKVFQVDNCYLTGELENKIKNELYKYAIENKLSFYNLNSHKGFMRSILLRSNVKGDIMVLLIFGEEDFKQIDSICNFLMNSFPQIASLHFAINLKLNDALTDLEINHKLGTTYISENIGNLSFRISPKSFFQTNPVQAQVLYNYALECAGTGKILYDLYCGTGTIGLCAATRFEKIIGIEYIVDAVEDAKQNALDNNIFTAHFFAGDMAKILNNEFITNNGMPDVVITDPPRSGMSLDVVKSLLDIECPIIIYISCNPATQARDILLLSQKYYVIDIQPVDMFPQTYHVEVIAKLELKITPDRCQGNI